MARSDFAGRAHTAAQLLWLSVGIAILPSILYASAPPDKEPKGPAEHARRSAPLFDGPKGKVMGSIPPGTPVTITKRAGPRVEVILQAWSRAYAPLLLVDDPSTMIPRGTLARIPDRTRKVVGEQVDAFEARWEKIWLTAWVDRSLLAPSVEPIWAEAIELQKTRCTVCHGFFPADRLNPSQWRGTLVIMAHRAALTPEENELLSQYLQTHARAPAHQRSHQR